MTEQDYYANKYYGDQQIFQHQIGVAIQQEELNLVATLKPRIFPDGNQWCVLLGQDLQEGVCGFGDTPMTAIYAFNQAFHTKL